MVFRFAYEKVTFRISFLRTRLFVNAVLPCQHQQTEEIQAEYCGRKDHDMSIDRVREYFKQYGMGDRILEFPVSSATVELAAQALGCEPCRIAKTLSFMVGEEPVLIVMAGDVKIDNTKYKAKFGKKAKMLTMDEVVPLIGHAVGGVCPFAVNEGVSTYLDESLKRFPTVFPACGSSNSAIELNMEELERFSRSKEWIDVTKVI